MGDNALTLENDSAALNYFLLSIENSKLENNQLELAQSYIHLAQYYEKQNSELEKQNTEKEEEVKKNRGRRRRRPLTARMP